MATPVNRGSRELWFPERNDFFFGKLMDVAQWQKDQRHFDYKRSLVNRLALGAGVMCGLRLEGAPDQQVRLLPGVALDEWGRESVVPSALTFDPAQPTDDAGAPQGPPLTSGLVEVRLAYAESGADPVPVLAADCDHAGPCAYGTVREGYRRLVRPVTGDPPGPVTCGLPDFPLDDAAEMERLVLARIADGCAAAPGDPSIVVGRVNLDDGTVDGTAGRRPVVTNALLLELVLCLAARVSPLLP